MFRTSAIVKNTAPKKHLLKKGLVKSTEQPVVHTFPLVQLINSRAKLYQANTVPPSNTINSARRSFLIY